MLPGPPVECLPMFDQLVLPTLKENNFQKILHYEKWLLFGISEAELAEELDKIAQPFDCITGYRFCYPYIEFKLYSNNQADFTALLVPLIKKEIAPYIIGEGKTTASDSLKKKILTLNSALAICDLATGGLLESILKTPATNSQLNFSTDLKNSSAELQVKITGLAEFWKKEENYLNTMLEMRFINQGKQQINKISIPFRSYRVQQYAVEFICWKIYEFLG